MHLIFNYIHELLSITRKSRLRHGSVPWRTPHWPGRWCPLPAVTELHPARATDLVLCKVITVPALSLTLKPIIKTISIYPAVWNTESDILDVTLSQKFHY